MMLWFSNGRTFYWLCILALAGCAGAQKQETLGDLGELDIKIDTESPIVGSRNKAMDNYWEFMSGTKQDSQKVEAMRRLADLEMERSEERFQKQMEVFAESDGGADADADTLREITFRGAIKLYEDALKLSEGGKQAAGLLYQVSKAYEQAGQQEKALDALNRLLALNPRAANRDELQFRRGELLFDLRKFKLAELAYTQAITVGTTSRYYEKAVTKQGWTLFKQGKYQRSLKTFFALADRKLKPGVGLVGTRTLSRGDKELVDDVFRIVTLTFNELGGAPAIKDYFDKNGRRSYEIRVYRDLAEFYTKKNRVRDAAQAYHAFAKNFPMHEQAYVFDLKAIESYTQAGFASVLIEEKRAFIKRYRRNGSYWKRYEEQEDTILAQLKVALRKNSEDVVRHFHAAAQKSKTAVAYQTAFIWYRQHLKWFAQGKGAQKLNFLYAELLFESGSFEKAAKEYEKTAYRYLRFGKDAEAGYAALLSYAEAEKKAKGKQKSTWSRLAVGSALRFGKTFPGDKRAAQVLTKAAQDMFALKKFNQAAVAARQILELSGGMKPEARRTAWKIIARAEFEKGDYTRAEVAYKVALSLTGIDDAGRKALKDGLAAAVYKQGEYMKSKGNLQGAIAQFARVQQVSPNSAVIQSAEFDIAASLMEAKNWLGAIKKFSAFREKHPAHPLTAKVSENLVTAYLKNKQPLKAAAELENLAANKTDPEIKRAALWQAAELYESDGSQQQVIATYKRYVGMFPEPMEQATEARNKLAVIYGKSGRPGDRRYWLQEIIRRDKNAGKASTPRTQYLAAKAAFELAEPALQLFQQVKLVRPLKQNLKRKKQKMKAAVDAFTLAADYGIAEVTTASVYWLAEIYNEFGRELMNSERPDGLSEEELEQYDILLEEQAYPFEEKSITIHESNVGRVSDGTFDEWVKKSFAELRKLSPVRYSKFEKSEPTAQYIY
jgi:tetratricopeptide (TPR) repeat protein